MVTSVQFGTARATDFDVTRPDELTVTSPPAPSNAKSVDVTVTTSAGTSTTSTADVFTYIPTAPGAPTGVTATVAGSSSAAVSWNPPATDGGSPITGYLVNNLRSGKSTGTPTKVGVVTSAIVTGLVPGDAYSFSVTAVTAIGSTDLGRLQLGDVAVADVPSLHRGPGVLVGRLDRHGVRARRRPHPRLAHQQAQRAHRWHGHDTGR